MEEDDLPGYNSARTAALVEALEQAAGEGAPAALGPARRARELRRALEARGTLPAATLAAVWREVEAVRLARADALRIALWGGARDAEAVAAQTRRLFGATAPLALAQTAEQALAAAEAEAVIAVLALEGAWWGRLLARPRLRVFAAAWPLLGSGPPLALAVSAAPRGAPGGARPGWGPEPPRPPPPGAAAPVDATGDDRTFWVTDAPGPPARVEAALAEAGFAADLAAQAGGLMLFALAGYVQPHDARLAQAPGRLTGVIGAAPFGLCP